MKLSLTKIKKRIFTIPSLLMTITIISYFLRFMVDWKFNIQSFIWFVAALIPFIYVLRKDVKIAKIMTIYFAIDLIAFVNMLINGSHAPLYIGVLFATQCWGTFLYCERKELEPLEILGTILIFYLLYRVLTTPKTLINSWQYGIILSKLVRQNTVSIFLCEFLTYVLLNEYFCKKRTNYLIFSVAFVTAIICGGMGGILSTTAYLIGSIVIIRKADKISWRIVSLLIISVVLYFVFWGDFKVVIKEVLDDNGRIYIWRNYYHCINSVKDFIVGADVSDVYFLKLTNNMHNTFINYHYCYGLIPFVFFIFRHIQNFIYCIKEKKHLFLIIMLVTTLRAFTDESEFAFGGIWTFIWLMSVNDRLTNSNNKKSNQE